MARVPLLQLSDIALTFGGDPVFDGLDLVVQPGDRLALVGRNGSGKSTLMNLLGCLDTPTSGSYTLEGIDVATLPDEELSAIRGRKIGFVFQAFNLISELDIVENVCVPLLYQGIPRPVRRQRALEALDQVGLGDRTTHRPRELSGGQQQRVAVARALVTKPAIVLADEPTGNLDSATERSLLDLFDQLHDDGMTMIIVTHEPTLAERCERIIRLKDGSIDTEEAGGKGEGKGDGEGKGESQPPSKSYASTCPYRPLPSMSPRQRRPLPKVVKLVGLTATQMPKRSIATAAPMQGRRAGWLVTPTDPAF